MANENPFSGRVIFDHIGKTGGMAVTAWLTSVLGNGSVTKDLFGTHSNLIRQYGGLYPVISAHICFDEPLDPRYQYITLLRNPVDRVSSWLYFAAYTVPDIPEYAEQKKIALEAIISNGQSLTLENINNLKLSDHYVSHFSKIEIDAEVYDSQNDIQKALNALKQYDVVGVYENFPRFLEETSLLFGILAPQSIPRVNETNYQQASIEKRSVSPSLLAFLSKINKKDLSLYQELTSWKNSQLSMQPTRKSSSRKPPKLFNKMHQVAELTINNLKSYSGEMVLAAGSQRIKPAEHSWYTVLIRNASDVGWQSDGKDFCTLATYHWYTSNELYVFDGIRTSLPNGYLETGQSIEMDVNVMAPDIPGEYILMLTLVREGVSWYEHHDFKPVSLRVSVVESD